MLLIVGVVLNTGKEQAVPIAKRMLADMHIAQVEALIETESARLLGLPGGVPSCDVYSHADVLLVFGGDGTILGVVEGAAKRNVPILGLNTGRLGFLTEMDGMSSDWLGALVNKQYSVDQRMMIVARYGENEHHALNDFVLSRYGHHILQFKVLVGGRMLGRYAADGVIIATPTGSTAYSLSAGGPVISPKLQCMVVAPICPHTLWARPVVIAPDEEIELRVSTDAKSACFSGDGIAYPIVNGESIFIRRSPYCASFIRFNERNFYTLLNAKLSGQDME